MSLGKHLEDAAGRLEAAHRRIELAREQQPISMEALRDWLEALTVYAEATHDLQRFSDEGLSERVQQLSGTVSHRQVASR